MDRDDLLRRAEAALAAGRLRTAIELYDGLDAEARTHPRAVAGRALASSHPQVAGPNAMPAAEKACRHAIALAVDDSSLRQAAAAVLAQLAMMARASDPERAEALLAEAAVADPTSPAVHYVLLDLDLGRPRRWRLEEVADGLSKAALGHCAFVACMPKSGSSLLTGALCLLLDRPLVPTSFAAGRGEQEIYLPALLRHAQVERVVQQHCRATQANLALLQAFDIRPAVLTRDIPDALVSLADQLASPGGAASAFVEDFATWPRARQLDFVIADRAPWYAQFHASWARAERTGQAAPIRVTYEEIIADPAACLIHLLDVWDLPADPDRVASVLRALEAPSAQGLTRLNVGRSGRGREELSDAQMTRLRELAAFHPDIDFAPVGL